MSTTAIYVKTEKETKEKAQKIAKELGLSLSAVVNGYLKLFIRTKTVTFQKEDEVPNKNTLAVIKQAEENLKKGKHSPIFKTGEEAVAWLEKKGI